MYILTFIFVFTGFCCGGFLLLLFSLLWEVKHGTALPCDVLGKVVWGVHLQGFCGSGVLRKQSQHRWCSMPLHMAGSQPGELTILLSSCLSSFSVLYVCQCPLLSVFLPVICTCWPCLYWSAMLSFSVSVCLHLCSFVCLSMYFCYTDYRLVPAQLKHNWKIITLFTIKILNPASYKYIYKPDMIFAGYAFLEWKGYIFVPYTSCGKIVVHIL